MKYDYLIIGSGLFGSVFAHEATKSGKKCMVIEKRSHIGGNIYTEKQDGINVHKYGAHIFHTSNKKVWDYISSFVEMNHYINSPIANYNGEIYNLPFNMNTFSKMWGIKTPSEAKAIIEDQRKQIFDTPKNLEEQAISLVGRDIYEKLIKGYTEKQWGQSCTELPAFIIRRLPVRFIYDNNYFNDPFQGIPKKGYTHFIEKLLIGSDMKLNCDYFKNKDFNDNCAKEIVYTGMIDEYYDYCFGPLDYRSLEFVDEKPETDNYQGVAVVNYTDKETPYTRIIEHKHFEFGQQENTIITKEYSAQWKQGLEPYYPINNEKNQKIYERYAEKASLEQNVIFGGRLAEYKYYDMDKVIEAALSLSNKLFA